MLDAYVTVMLIITVIFIPLNIYSWGEVFFLLIKQRQQDPEEFDQKLAGEAKETAQGCQPGCLLILGYLALVFVYKLLFAFSLEDLIWQIPVIVGVPLVILAGMNLIVGKKD